MIETTIKVNDTMSMTKLTASDGMVLTNDSIYGKEIYLGVNDATSNWHEITDAEYEAIINSEQAEEADFIDALNKLGVK